MKKLRAMEVGVDVSGVDITGVDITGVDEQG